MDEKKTSFMVACKTYFGFAPGQTLMEFRDEVNKLTPADKEEMRVGLEKELNCVIG